MKKETLMLVFFHRSLQSDLILSRLKVSYFTVSYLNLSVLSHQILFKTTVYNPKICLNVSNYMLIYIYMTHKIIKSSYLRSWNQQMYVAKWLKAYIDKLIMKIVVPTGLNHLSATVTFWPITQGKTCTFL